MSFAQLVAANSNYKQKPLGEWLREREAITEAQLQEALTLQQKQGGRLGEIITNQVGLQPLIISETLAKQYDLPFVNLLETPVDASLCKAEQLLDYLRLGMIPYRLHQGTLSIALTDPKTPPAELIKLFPDYQLEYVITGAKDIAWALQHIFSPELLYAAREQLSVMMPDYALRGKVPLINYIKRSIIGLVALSLFAIGISWFGMDNMCSALLIAAALLFTSALLFKLALVMTGVLVRKQVFAHTHDVPLLSDDALPVYSVLVPLLDEAESVPALLVSLARLDYPKHKLDIKLIVEAKDSATLAAIKAACPPAYMQIIVVPDAKPTTKPKACNYALSFIKGEYITIYDAEDAPHAEQLRRAASMFRQYPQVACLQAQLNYYNAGENWLAGLFHIEYAMLFNVILPALYALQIPIPLGGTSNHLRTAILRRIGGWDAYNVTEDADIGIRLASFGYQTMPMDSLTLEEAPLAAWSWIKQRTRWIKGYMQTWIILQRRTGERFKRFGGIGFVGVHGFIGISSFIYVLAPLLWVAALLWMILPAAWLPEISDRAAYYSLYTLLAGITVQWFCLALLALTQKLYASWWLMLLYPFYFILHSVAGLRATWQLITAPDYWDKTTHSLTRCKRNALYTKSL